MKNVRIILLIFGALLLGLSSCDKEKTEPVKAKVQKGSLTPPVKILKEEADIDIVGGGGKPVRTLIKEGYYHNALVYNSQGLPDVYLQVEVMEDMKDTLLQTTLRLQRVGNLKKIQGYAKKKAHCLALDNSVSSFYPKEILSASYKPESNEVSLVLSYKEGASNGFIEWQRRYLAERGFDFDDFLIVAKDIISMKYDPQEDVFYVKVKTPLRDEDGAEATYKLYRMKKRIPFSASCYD